MAAADPVVYVPGARWGDVAGTDRRLAEALAERGDVVWVEPPSSFATRGADRRPSASSYADAVAPGVIRVRTTMPGFSRPVLSAIGEQLVAANVRETLSALGRTPAGVVLAAPLRRFPRGVAGKRVLYVTDDWVAGAAMMGLSRDRIERAVARSAREADLIAAVSAELGEPIARAAGRPFLLLPNGCLPPPALDPGIAREPVAGLVGQLNERLDLGLLEAVRDRGVRLLVVGPRTERDPAVRSRLDALLASPGVEWTGRVPAEELPRHLARMSVGLTPYADTAFNRASFPLKTLEYLAAGLRAVSTDLPAVRWLGTDLVDVASGPEAFAAAVAAAVEHPGAAADAERRRAFASGHTWGSRALTLREALTGTALLPDPERVP